MIIAAEPAATIAAALTAGARRNSLDRSAEDAGRLDPAEPTVMRKNAPA
jgi:hypothetical protein